MTGVDFLGKRDVDVVNETKLGYGGDASAGWSLYSLALRRDLVESPVLLPGSLAFFVRSPWAPPGLQGSQLPLEPPLPCLLPPPCQRLAGGDALRTSLRARGVRRRHGGQGIEKTRDSRAGENS